MTMTLNARLVASTVLFLSLLIALPANSQTIPLDSPDFVGSGQLHEITQYKGQEALKLKDAAVENMNLVFGNGTIEFDIALSHQRGFSGIRFHVGSGDQSSTMEEFYIRPHQRGNPDATQYTPVFNFLSGWQLYHGPQFSNDHTFEADTWQHVKIVVSGTRADIYLGDMETVALAIPELKSGIASGGIQLFSNMTTAHFANLRISHDEKPELIGTPVPLPPTPDTRIKTWSISSSFAADALGNDGTVDSEAGDLTWAVVPAEENGITNIARYAKISREANTSLARITLVADSARTLPFKFGYSDEVRVFLNGQELYSGSNRFRSRDYRYLGTIGLFDEVPLRLKKGENVLVLAVTEAFGGWGVMGDFEDHSGIEIEAR